MICEVLDAIIVGVGTFLMDQFCSEVQFALQYAHFFDSECMEKKSCIHDDDVCAEIIDCFRC